MRLKLFKKKLMPLLALRHANGLKTSYGDTFDKRFVFFWPKVPFSWDLLTLKHKKQIKSVKKNTCVAFNPKMRKWLKTSYGDTFDKLFVFFSQKCHFLEIHDTKTQKRD